MSQQVEKNIAEGQAAMVEKDSVSIMISTYFYFYYMYLLFYLFIFRKLLPTLLMKKMMLTKEHPLHHPPLGMM